MKSYSLCFNCDIRRIYFKDYSCAKNKNIMLSTNSSVPSWLVWFKYIGWFLYTNELLTINQWEGVEVNTCPDPTKPIPPCYTSGDQIIEAQGFDKVQ